ncbi:MAG TPA: hypothetical protein VGI29_11900 [Candidatus Binataceae bacterium]
MRSADTDLWGHIFFGRVILSQHQWLFHAPFSYACPAGPRDWIVHDWLGNVLMALIYGAAGVIGLKLAKFACVAAVMALLARGAAETRASLAVQAIALCLAAVALLPLMQIRTFLADDILFAALVIMLARDSYGCGARLWLVPPMFALWANLHGGFFVGLAAMGLYTAVRGAQALAQGKGMRDAVRLAALTSAAALATLINPYGLRELLVVVQVVHNPFTLAHISEFRSLPAVMADLYHTHRPLFTFLCAVAIMAATVAAFALTPRADDLALCAISLLMIVGALYAVRNTAMAVIACYVPLCRHADILAARLRPARVADTDGPSGIWRPLHVGLAVLALALVIRTGLLSRTFPVVEAKPAGAIAFMREHNLAGNVLCEFGWADYVIFHDSARFKIFIESMFEAYYPHQVQSDFAAVYYGEPGAARVLDQYPNDFVLMPTGSPAYTLMMSQAGWPLIYRDPVAALFARAGSRAARIGAPELVAAAPPSVFP